MIARTLGHGAGEIERGDQQAGLCGRGVERLADGMGIRAVVITELLIGFRADPRSSGARKRHPKPVSSRGRVVGDSPGRLVVGLVAHESVE